MQRPAWLACVAVALALTMAQGGDRPLTVAPLPPELPWHGKSETLVAPPSSPWITPCEASGLAQTPRYAETVAWLQRLAARCREVRLISLGQSPEGRDIWMAVASRERAFNPKALRATGKPILLVQAGIHSGEIDGKDAGMMLLRDLTVGGTRKGLLEKASLLFIPILNVDGHERFSMFNRINQRGPLEMGWRATAQHLNLNRDYGKLDTPEIRAVVRALDSWDPDLCLDIHVTDGVDYQYDVTFGYNGPHAYSPHIASWLDTVLTPRLNADLKRMGHIPGPLVLAVDDRNLSKGIARGTAGPRFSNGYGDVRHLPTVLVENHSLKSHRQRVLGTYVLIESALRVLGEQGKALREAVASDRAARRDPLPLSWRMPSTTTDTIRFLGVESRLAPSDISGQPRVEWTGRPVELTVPYRVANQPGISVSRPRAYWIPPAWQDVIARLRLHGIQMERLAEARPVRVEQFLIARFEMTSAPFEGHVQVKASLKIETAEPVLPAGSVRISTDQPLGDLAMLLLEPESPDSFFQWGFFLSVLQESEYAEAYVMEPLAAQMLADDPALKDEFSKKLKEDRSFASNPRERLQWFYRRSPFYAEQRMWYPVLREPAS